MNVLTIQKVLSTITLLLGFTVRSINGYSTGAPTRACGNMTPGHGYPVNTSPAPYLVEISKTQYSPNERIYVRLRACGNARFKGFMIQPRSAIFPDRPAFLGAFARVQGSRYECVRSGAVLTHNSPVEKQTMTLTWIAPPGAAGHVVFRQNYHPQGAVDDPMHCCPRPKAEGNSASGHPQHRGGDKFDCCTERVTFVQAFNSYWVGVNSPVVYDGISRDLTMMQAFSLRSSTAGACLPPTTAAATTTNAATRPTTTTTLPPPPPLDPTTTTPLPPTTTTEVWTTTTTEIPTTTTTEFTTTTTEIPTTTTTEFTTTTTEPTTTMEVPTTTTTTTEATTTTTRRATIPTTWEATTYWPSGATSTDYWPDYWDTTTQQAAEPATQTQTPVPTIFPTEPDTTTTTTALPTTTTQQATTTTTVTIPPSTTTTTVPTTTTTTAATTTTTTIQPTTTTDFPTTTTTAALPTTTTQPLPPTTTTTQPPPAPTTTTTPVYEPTIAQTTTYYDASSLVPTAVWPTAPWPDYMSEAPTIPTRTTGNILFVPESLPTTVKRVDVNATTDKVTTEYIPDMTFPQFTEKDKVQVYTTTVEPLMETSTVEGTSTVDTMTFPWETTETAVVIKSDLELVPDRGCVVTQGCFDDCRNGVCNFIISWKPDRYSTRFEIRTKPGMTGPYWAAIGFSDDRKMGLDSVTECITEGEKIKVYQSYNLDYYRNLRLLTPKLGISEEYGKVQNGIFHCSFTRENYVEGEKEVSNLNKDWFMMFAEGPAVNGIKIPHRYDAIPPMTDVRINLQQYPPMHVQYDPVQAQAHMSHNEERHDSQEPLDKQRYVSVDETCGVGQSCLQDCTPFGCRFIVSWISGKEHVIFKLRAALNATVNRWIAIAFSHDNKMGDDSVVQCVSNDNGEISVSQSYNRGKINMKIDEPQSGISNTSGSFVDGVFECGFVRQKYVENTEEVFDLEKPWNILFASGRSKSGIMLPHSFDALPHASDHAVNFTKADFDKLHPTLLTADTLFIKIHASLMLFAWILCASIATVIGRYFQPYWWGEKMVGTRAWIRVHWLFVILTLLSVVASFSLIFVGVDGMSKLYQNPGASFNSAHPIMGLIVAVLVLLNPLLLLLRPSDESQTRAFFDCLYWIVEMGAHILAVITIYAGFGLAAYLVPAILAYCLIGFACYQVLVLLFMEGLKSYDAKKTVEKKKMYLYEMQIRPWNPRRNNSFSHYMDVSQSSKGLKRVILSFHFLVLTALTTAMIVLLVISEPTDNGLPPGLQPTVH